MTQIVLWTGALIAFALLLKFAMTATLTSPRSIKPNYAYQKKSAIMTDAEVAFFNALT